MLVPVPLSTNFLSSSQKHIFPGGFLPSFTVLCQAISGHKQFIVEHLENIGVNYARTLREWRLRFISHTDQIANMGFDKAFIRKWIYYLSCCEAGFERRVLGDIQMVLRRAKIESEDGYY
jgi:cyclopropane-fatty-acyl-phospholipid synthase